MSPASLELRALCCGYRARTVIDRVSLSLRSGELLCLVGPNGVGKTTLFKTILGLQAPLGGSVLADGEAVAGWSRRRLARHVAYVPQAHSPPFAFRTADVVAMGRVAHLGSFAAPGAADHRLAAQALTHMGIAHLAELPYTEISGGERQLVLIARALAQQARVLVMDEPTANLDYGNQVRVMAHVRELVDRQDIAVILTTHQPDHALLYGTHAMAIQTGGSYRLGTPSEVIDEDYLRQTYGVDAEIHTLIRRDGVRARLCVAASAHRPDGGVRTGNLSGSRGG